MHTVNQRKSRVIAMTILVGDGIQNSYFDKIFNINGMDAISLFLTVAIVVFFLYVFLCGDKWTVKCNEFILMLYFSLLTFIGFFKAGINKNSMLLFRTSMYFFFVYIIFLNLRMTTSELINSYRIAGTACALTCLFFYYRSLNTYGVEYRNVSFNLGICVFAIFLELFVEMDGDNLLRKIISVFICFFAVFTSQQRTQIIPTLCIGMLLFVSCLGFELNKIIKLISVIFMSVTVLVVSHRIGVLELIANRFKSSSMWGGGGTLFIRLNDTKNVFSSMSIIEWIFGSGLDGLVELEMLLPNLIYKYGILGLFLIVWNCFIPVLYSGYSHKGSHKRLFLIGFCILLTGGLVSGLGGCHGQLFLASILASIINKRILSSEDKVCYSIPLGQIKDNISFK